MMVIKSLFNYKKKEEKYLTLKRRKIITYCNLY